MRAEKTLLLEEIKNKIESNEAVIITSYSKLSAVDTSEFRNQMYKTGAEFEVVAKRLFIRAANECGITFDRKDLQGHIGIIFSNTEVIDTAKMIFAYSKEHENAIEVLAGHFDGELYDAKKVEMLSKLPSKDEMRAQFIGLLEAPMAETLGTMDALLTSIIHCMNNKAEKVAE